jgi:hypothetical protein
MVLAEASESDLLSDRHQALLVANAPETSAEDRAGAYERVMHINAELKRRRPPAEIPT